MDEMVEKILKSLNRYSNVENAKIKKANIFLSNYTTICIDCKNGDTYCIAIQKMMLKR